MLSHQKLILIFLLLILIVALILLKNTRKKNQENFTNTNSEFITNISGVRYDDTGFPSSTAIDENCPDGRNKKVILTSRKDKMIYPKLCYKREKRNYRGIPHQ